MFPSQLQFPAGRQFETRRLSETLGSDISYMSTGIRDDSGSLGRRRRQSVLTPALHPEWCVCSKLEALKDFTVLKVSNWSQSSSCRPDSSLKQEVFHQLTERWTGNTTVPNPTDSVSRSTSHHMTDRVQSNKSEPRKQDLSQKTKPSPRFNSLSELRTSQVRSNKFWVKDCKIRVQDKDPRSAGTESSPTLTV